MPAWVQEEQSSLGHNVTRPLKEWLGKAYFRHNYAFDVLCWNNNRELHCTITYPNALAVKTMQYHPEQKKPAVTKQGCQTCREIEPRRVRLKTCRIDQATGLAQPKSRCTSRDTARRSQS